MHTLIEIEGGKGKTKSTHILISRIFHWSFRQPILENVKNLDDATIAKWARPSIQPQFPGTHPAKSVPAWNERSTFIPSHAHATHRIIPLFSSSFLRRHRRRVPNLRLLQQPHQRHPPWCPRRPTPAHNPFPFSLWPPELSFRRQRRRQIHSRRARTHAVVPRQRFRRALRLFFRPDGYRG